MLASGQRRLLIACLLLWDLLRNSLQNLALRTSFGFGRYASCTTAFAGYSIPLPRSFVLPIEQMLGPDAGGNR